MINIGSLTGIITTLLGTKVSFGMAFMVPLVAIFLGMVMFVASNEVLSKINVQAYQIGSR
jgi:dipeptide/tripeptide permease